MIDELYVPNDEDYIISPCTDGVLTVELWNGSNTSQILSRTFSDLSSSIETHVITLTSGERNAITDWNNLSLHLSVNGTDTAVLALAPLNTPQEGPVLLYIRARGI